jgi:hypothetical protein
LAQAAKILPPDRRSELVSEIREHITASLSGGTGTDESSVRTMLDRIGEPEDIVAAAMEIDPPERPTCPPPPQRRQQGVGLEVGAVIMLTAGSLILVFGWLVGVILVWSSGLWTRSEKILATLIFPGGPGLALFGGAAVMGLAASHCVTSIGTTTAVQVFPTAVASAGQILPTAVASSGQIIPSAEVCTSSALAPVLWIGLLLFVLIAPVVVAIVLLGRARSRAAMDSHEAIAEERLARHDR